MLLDLFPDALHYQKILTFNPQAERVEASEQLLYLDLVLEESRTSHADPELVAALLAKEALARGPRSFAPEGALDRAHGAARLRRGARPRCRHRHAHRGRPRPGAQGGRGGTAELRRAREADLPGLLLGRLDPRARAALDRLAPVRLTLPGGRQARIRYEAQKPPWLESRLQDFFGMAEGPRIALGRVPLVLHLLAPNGRAQQVTTDLAGFWDRHYPALRRELSRRYPRHSWPENPRTAVPPAPRRR